MSPLQMIGVAMAGISVITMFAYALDKRSARRGGWRIPETTLHVMELLGGWPGALLAQFLLRHKNAKLGYQIVFWFIVLLHAAGWLWYWHMR